MKKIGSAVAVGICIFAMILMYGHNVQRELSDKLLRLHIVANSNSEIDQKIKLAVRDGILEESKGELSYSELCIAAEKSLLKTGANYGISTSLGRYYVPEKSYKDISLPEGTYNCLRVVLGEGKGENWWCVAYPPLCFSEEVFGGLSEDGRHRLAEVLDRKTLNAIVDNGEVNFRFKIVEAVQKIIKNV